MCLKPTQVASTLCNAAWHGTMAAPLPFPARLPGERGCAAPPLERPPRVNPPHPGLALSRQSACCLPRRPRPVARAACQTHRRHVAVPIPSPMPSPMPSGTQHSATSIPTNTTSQLAGASLTPAGRLARRAVPAPRQGPSSHGGMPGSAPAAAAAALSAPSGPPRPAAQPAHDAAAADPGPAEPVQSAAEPVQSGSGTQCATKAALLTRKNLAELFVRRSEMAGLRQVEVALRCEHWALLGQSLPHIRPPVFQLIFHSLCTPSALGLAAHPPAPPPLPSHPAGMRAKRGEPHVSPLLGAVVRIKSPGAPAT